VVGVLDTVVRNLPFVEPSIANVVVVAVLAVILVIFPAGLFGRQVPGH
jgi:branched-subunit amino acid ABC-type transport system permease component